MKFLTTTLLTLLSSLLTPPSAALPATTPELDNSSPIQAPRDLLAPRQAASARITDIVKFTGDGCPNRASFAFTIGGQGSSIAITFTNFIVTVPAPSSTTVRTCDLSIQMTFPKGCLSLAATTAQYSLFGRFGDGVSAGIDSTYRITAPGRIVNDNNPPRRFSGPQFADGEAVSLTERVGINFNTPQLVKNVNFTLGILDAMTAGGGAAAGGTFQVRGVTWSLGTQTAC